MKNKSLWILASLLLIVFLSRNYISNNLDEIYSLQGDFYFKKNEISKAQEAYERAFELGFDKLKQREIYVNSIIYSPLTPETQEKLVRFLKNPKEDIARVKAEYFLSDLKREIHRKYPDNYITNAVFNQKILRWADLPITYVFQNQEIAPKYFVREIENAFTV